jgi:hypothetical protein
VTGGGTTLGSDWQSYIDEVDRIKSIAVAAANDAEDAKDAAETAEQSATAAASAAEAARDAAQASATAAAGSAASAAADAESAEQVLVNINGLDAEGKKSYHGSFNMDFRINGRLIGVSVLDRALDSLSSVYFYFDTAEDILSRSVGVFSVLKEIEACRGEIFGGTLKAGWYYLGYYIEDCRKMNYKAQYNPHQLLDIGGKWKYDGGKNEASRKDG